MSHYEQFLMQIILDKTEAATRVILLKKVFLKISQNSPENTSATVSFLKKSQASGRLVTLLKRRLWHRCFLVNFAKFLTTPLQLNTSGQLLLIKVSKSEHFRLAI